MSSKTPLKIFKLEKKALTMDEIKKLSTFPDRWDDSWVDPCPDCGTRNYVVMERLLPVGKVFLRCVDCWQHVTNL